MHRPWIRAMVLGVLAAAVTAAPGWAALPSDLALIERTGAGFISVRPAALLETSPVKALTPRLRRGLDRSVKEAEDYLGVAASDTERVTAVLLSGPIDPLLIVRTAQPFDRQAVLPKVLGPKYTESKHRGWAVFLGGRREGQCVVVVDERVFVVGSLKQVRRLSLLDLADHTDRELGRGVAWAAEKYHVVAAVKRQDVLLLFGKRRAEARSSAAVATQAEPAPASEPPPLPKDRPESEESEDPPARGGDELNWDDLLAELPWEAWPYKPLFLAQTGLATLDLGDESKLHGRLTFVDDPAARDGEMSLRVVLYVAREWIARLPREMRLEPEAATKLTPTLRQAQAAIQAAPVKRSGRVVEATATLKTGSADLRALLVQAERAAQRAELGTNLKMIALAMHDYHNDHGAFPGVAICDKNGKPLLSWRVAILPYIEGVNLYNQFKLDEPWDSPHNKRLLNKMPRTYAISGREGKGADQTYFRVFTGSMTPFDLSQTRPGPTSLGIRMSQITDGTSQTLLVVEAAESVPWTKPDELPFDPKMSLPKLGGTFRGVFFAVFADGSVHELSTKIDKDTLRALITPAGSENVDWDRYEVGSGTSRRGTSDGSSGAAAQPPDPGPPPTSAPPPAPPRP